MEENFLLFYEKLKKENKNPQDYFVILIEALYEYYSNLWSTCSCILDFQSFGLISTEIRSGNKKDIDAFLNKLITSCLNLDKNIEDEKLKHNFRTTVLKYIESSPFFKTKITTHYPMEFINTTGQFVRKSKSFDNNFNFYDIFQALRNVWTMNILQSIFGEEVKLTPTVFGYSMLYPYTDNLLDSRNITITEKEYISARLADRLSGKQLLPFTPYEEKVFRLITDIEEYFPRKDFYAMYKSLSFIHYFQTRSLHQQTRNTVHTADIIEELSFKKGGMSVLADAYLIKGNLNMKEVIFSFGLGIVLQLLDDLQDINADMRNNNVTIFTLAAASGKLDNVTIKMLNFINMVISSVMKFDSPLKVNINKALFDNCTLMVLFSISRNKSLFSSDFVRNIKQFYPFPSAYMKGFNKKLQRVYYKLKKINNLEPEDIFNILLDK